MQTSTRFDDHTIETAPQESRRGMTATQKHLGYLPTALGRMAESPELLEGFQRMTAMFERVTLDKLAREVVIMTMATHNGCHLCVAMHTATLTSIGAPAEVITALRDQRPLDDERLEAVRTFTLEALATTGQVSDETLQSFFSHGLTKRNALEIMLGIGTYTMSTFANRLTDAPVDPPLEQFAW